MNRILIAIAAFVIWTMLAFLAGQEWRDRSAETDTATRDTADARGEAQAQAGARVTERQQAGAAQQAGDQAATREDKIDADYDARIAAAVAGRDSELGRLRNQWAACETSRLSDPAAAAAEASRQDGLRRASAARIVRACELAQSERDEAVDRYQAVATDTGQVKP